VWPRGVDDRISQSPVRQQFSCVPSVQARSGASIPPIDGEERTMSLASPENEMSFRSAHYAGAFTKPRGA
jgi:hypothetical protein